MGSDLLVYNESAYKFDVIKDVFIADTFMERFMGYMFRREPHYEAIMFKPCNSIHTFFMKFHIDVIFINKDMEIVKKVENLGPGKIVIPVKDAVIVIEAKQGAFENLKVGDKVAL